MIQVNHVKREDDSEVLFITMWRLGDVYPAQSMTVSFETAKSLVKQLQAALGDQPKNSAAL